MQQQRNAYNASMPEMMMKKADTIRTRDLQRILDGAVNDRNSRGSFTRIFKKPNTMHADAIQKQDVGQTSVENAAAGMNILGKGHDGPVEI